VSLTCQGRAPTGQTTGDTSSSSGAGTSTSLLEQITPTGSVTYGQYLSDCLAVNSIESSLPGGPAIVEAANLPIFVVGGCNTGPETRISEYTMGHLRTILNLPATELSMPD
jgi:hypothetical protein